VRDEALGLERCLKRVEIPTATAAAALRDEFRALAGLSHPQLVRAHDFGVVRDGAASDERTSSASCFFTSELVRGVSLDTFAVGRSFEAVKPVLVDALSALAYLHAAGIVHGDFKPENVLAHDGRATLIDLSCARRIGAPGLISGTPGFMAPEILRGDAPDGRSDLYAVGRTLTGLEDLLGDGLPERVRLLAARCLCDEPSMRPTEIGELLEAFGVSARDLYPADVDATRIHGRDHELGLAREIVASLHAGEPLGPRVVVVHGATGSGKSRMLREIVWQAQLECDVVEGFPHVGGDAITSMLRRARGVPIDGGSLDVASVVSELDDLPTPMVLVVDDVDALGVEGRTSLEALAGAVAKSRRLALFVASDLAGTDVPILRIDLGSIDAAAVAAWATEIGLSSHAKTLFRRSAGHPSDVRAVAVRIAAGEADTAEGTRARLARVASAERLADVATSLDERLEAAHALEDAGALDRALEVLAAAVLDLASPVERAEYAVRTSAILLAKGNPAESLAAIARAPRDADPPRLADLAAVESRALTRLGRHAEAREAAARGLALATTPSSRADLHEALGVAASYAGDYAEAARSLSAAVALHADLASPRRLVRVLSYRAIDAYRAGDLDGALDGYRRALDVAERGGVVEQIARASLNVATALHQRGAFGEAASLYERGERVAAALEQDDLLALFELDLAKLWADLGAWDRATERASRALRAAVELGAPFFAAAARSILGDVALATGDAPRSIALFTEARDAFAREGAHREVAEEELELARAHVEAGDLASATEALSRARSAGALDALDLHARTHLLEGHVARADGDLAGAATHFAEAVRRAGETKSADLLASVHAGAGRLDQARSLWASIELALPEVHRAAFRAHPKRRSAFEAPAPQREAESTLPIARTSDRIDKLERLLAVFRRLNSVIETRDVLGLALDAAIELTGAERGFVIVSESEGGELTVPVARNVDREQVGKSHLKFSRSIAEQAIATGAPVLTVDATSDDRFRSNVSVHAMRLRSVIAVPIRSPEGVLGALYLDNRFTEARFVRGDADLLLAFADQVALALRNARLLEDLKRRTVELDLARRRAEELAEGRAREIDRLEEEARARQEVLSHRHDFSSIVGRGAAMQRIFRTLDRVIDAPLPVLVLGESGTGKELVARAIHFQSRRSAGPFVGINCAALPPSLLESELFGHVRGAFTGAERDRTGLVALATGGTLFLDELGEMPLEVQAKLLRVLQEREVRPVGSAHSMPVDFRLVTATNRDLKALVVAARFREDLYYRVGVVEVTLPPLRERMEDLRELAEHFTKRAAASLGKPAPSLSGSSLRKLASHSWPGNVRELENVVTKAVVYAEEAEIAATDIELPKPARRVRTSKRDDDRAQIVQALERVDWNAALAARNLGMPRATFYRRLARHSIVRPRG